MGHAVPRLETMRPLALLLAAACYFPAALAGQVVEGQVVDTITGQPIGNGFVVLLDGTGTEVARWLSGRGGRFSIRAPGPGRYRVRSERIGYRAAESPWFELVPGQTLTYLLQISPLPVHLADIKVRSTSACRIPRDEGKDTFMLWGEIRKALAATVWSGREKLFTYTKYTYERDLDAARRQRLHEVGRLADGVHGTPYRSRSASQLARDGYVITEAGESWYYLPEASVLLETEFVETHCFKVVRDQQRSGQVGLAFAPVPRRDLPDIEGVMWVDEGSGELGVLDIRYTGLPGGIDDDRIGGQVEFARLPTGAFIVRRWEVRAPMLEIEERERLFVRRPRQIVHLNGFHDTGGEVLVVTDLDGVEIYRAPLAQVDGTVFDSTRMGPLAGASVTIAQTNITTVTDSAGTFHLAAPLDGAYSVTVAHPSLDSMGFVEPTTTVTLTRGSTVSLVITVPHVNTLLERLCPEDKRGSDDRVLIGRVRNLTAVRGATVRASWQHVRADPVTFLVQEREQRTVSDAAGRYVLCGLPNGRPLTVTADDGQWTSRTAHVLFPATTEGTLSFDWNKVPGSAYARAYPVSRPWWMVDLTLVRELEDGSNRSVLRGLAGVVTDSATGEPIAAVRVSVNGRERTVTAEDGSFDVAVAEERSRVDVVTFRRIGYEPLTRDVAVDAAQPAVFLPVALSPIPVELAELIIEGEPAWVRAKLEMVGFYDRMEQGWGDFLTEADIERLVATDMIEVVRSVPGVNYIPPSGANTVGRVGLIRFFRAPPLCGGVQPAVYLDGFLFRAEDLLSVFTANVAAVELYIGLSVPIEFNRTGSACGVILIWTK